MQIKLKKALSCLTTLMMVLTSILGMNINVFAEDTVSIYTPLTVTAGFNEDLIAETYPAETSTTISFDTDSTTTSTFVLYSQSYVREYQDETGNESVAGALPDNRIVYTDNTSLGGLVEYNLAPYDGNNALRLSKNCEEGTFEFAGNNNNYSKISILGSSASGFSTMEVTIKYSDTSTDTQSFQCKDWFGNSDYVLSNLGRVIRTKTGSWPSNDEGEPLGPEANGPYLYEYLINTDSTKSVTGITFEQTHRSQDDTTTVLMAVSGVVEGNFVAATGIPNVPETATAGTDLTLPDTVTPDDASSKTIVWRVKDVGTTGATIEGNTLSATAAGTVVVTATVRNGLAIGTPYIQDFTITLGDDSGLVHFPLFDIQFTIDEIFDCQRSPAYPTVGNDFKVSSFKAPYNAGSKKQLDPANYQDGYFAFTWAEDATIDDLRFKLVYYENGIEKEVISSYGYLYGLFDEGFFYEGEGHYGYILSFQEKEYGEGIDFGVAEHGKITDIDDLLDYDDSNSAFIAVTNITSVPYKATVGTDLTLSGTVVPKSARRKTIVWTVKDAGTTGATIVNGKLKTTAPGEVTVLATIANGFDEETDYTQEFTIVVAYKVPAPGGTLSGNITQEIVDEIFGEGNATYDPDTETIKLEEDIDLDNAIIIGDGTNIIIDLNSHDISGGTGADGNGQNAIEVDNAGSLTIIDSLGDGSVSGGDGEDKQSENGGNGGNAIVSNGGNVIIDGADIKGGDGGDSETGNGGNGGNAISGDSGDINIINGSDISGGDGGNSEEGKGGNGGIGTNTQSGSTTVDGSIVTGGNGGNSQNSNAGNGGNATNSQSGNIIIDDSLVSGGNGGNSIESTGGTGGTGISNPKGSVSVDGTSIVTGGNGGDSTESNGGNGGDGIDGKNGSVSTENGSNTTAGMGGNGASGTASDGTDIKLTSTSSGGSNGSTGSSGSSSYLVTFESNGGSGVSSQRVKQNGKVTKPSDPARDGYKFTGWYSDKGLTKIYDFDTVVTGYITLYAGWETGSSVTSTPGPSVTPSPAVTDEWEEKPYINGYPDGSFTPENGISRAEVAQALYNLFDQNSAVNTGILDRLSDVDSNHWAAKAIAWAVSQGYIRGYTDNTMRPDQTITRAELVAVLQNVADKENLLGDVTVAQVSFSDIDGYWAYDAITELAGKGVVTGYPDGTFKPKNTITRAEAVSMIARLSGRSENFENMKSFDDVPQSYWAYKIIMNAVNGLKKK